MTLLWIHNKLYTLRDKNRKQLVHAEPHPPPRHQFLGTKSVLGYRFRFSTGQFFSLQNVENVY